MPGGGHRIEIQLVCQESRLIHLFSVYFRTQAGRIGIIILEDRCMILQTVKSDK